MSIRLSIVTVCYNAKKDLAKTVSNITHQDFNDYELIIVDGDSSDGTKEYLQTISSNPNIRTISEKDSGIYDAMNKGVSLASGDWILFLNAGDILYDASVLSNVFLSIKSHSDIWFGNCMLSDGSIKIQKNSFLYILRYNICHQSMFIKRSVLERNPYDWSEYPLVADNAMIIELYDSLIVQKLDLTVCIFDLSGISSNKANSSNVWHEKYKAYKRSSYSLFKKSFAKIVCSIITKIKKLKN